jgi:hypothetical protein
MDIFRKKTDWQFYSAQPPIALGADGEKAETREGVTIGMSNMVRHGIMIAVNYVDYTSDDLESEAAYIDADTAERIATQLVNLAVRLRAEQDEAEHA